MPSPRRTSCCRSHPASQRPASSPLGRRASQPPEPQDPPMTRKLTATPYLFLLPALVLLAVFVLYPIVAVIVYSFTDYDIVRPPVFVGLANFERLIGDETFWLAL